MALINCPECGKEVSDLAASCPNCGCPIKSVSPATEASLNSAGIPSGVPSAQPAPAPYPNPTPGPQTQSQQVPKRKESAWGIVGLILSVFFCLPIFPVIGFVLCIIAIRDKRHSSVCATIGLIISIFSLLFGIFVPQYMKYVDKARSENSSEVSTGTTNTSSTRPKPTATPKPTSTPVVDETQKREDFIASCEEIPYKTLARYPEDNAGKHIVLTVQISQIIQAGLFDDSVYYRVCTDNDGYGLYFDDEYLMYDSRTNDNRKLLADDIIRVYGEFIGTESITRALTGTTEDVPAFNAYYIDILDEDMDMTEECITLDEFNQIENGMSYEEVVEIIGVEGEMMSSMDLMGITTTIYTWRGKDAMSSAVITFEGNAVESKSQFGLE